MRIDGMFNGGQINLQSLGDLTSKLSPGDVVRAQILDFIANEVLLKLMDSTTVRASVPEGFEGEIGKFTNFIVKESLPDKLVLEEQKANIPKSLNEDANILKELAKAGISQTSENVKLAKAIMENNLPLTKESFDNVSKLIQTSKEIDIPKAIFMEANKIDATQNSIKQLGLLEKGSISLGNQIDELISLLDEVAENKPTLEGQSIQQNKEAGESQKINTTGANIENEKANIKLADTQNVKVPLEIKTETNDKAANKIENNKTNTIKQNEQLTNEKSFDAESFLKSIEDSINPKESKIKARTHDDKNADPSKEDAASGQKSTKNMTAELKKDVEKLFIKLENPDKEKNVELEKSIKNLGEKLQEVKEQLAKADIPNKEVILNKVDNILNQLRFIDDVKNFGYYVPIPLKLNGVLEQADLYVLKRNKNKKVNPEDATVFLALDTNNMGRVETLCCINKRAISLNMRVESKEYEDYLRTRFVDLYNLLASKGYKLTDIKYRQIDEPINMFNVNKVAKELLSTQAGGLDIRL